MPSESCSRTEPSFSLMPCEDAFYGIFLSQELTASHIRQVFKDIIIAQAGPTFMQD